MARDFDREFGSPGALYRGHPFWAWNGALDPRELRRQVRLMKAMGLGGFFMHSRVGLATPYLGEEWFRCIDACIDEARRQGMVAWLYDEDRWPSGAAGGIVTKDSRWRRRSLGMSILARPSELKWTADTVAAFVARVDGATATGVRRLSRGRKPASLAAGESILAFRVVVEQPRSWFNDGTYLDTLNPAAVRRFIAVTHEAYAARASRSFGRAVPGIFTDEPYHGHKLSLDGATDGATDLPWTAGLPAAFQRRHGYDLLPHLVELFLDVDGRQVTPARHDYHDCLTALFVDAFARQTGEWCEAHGLMHTGHVLMEDSLSAQAEVVGSAMRFYEHMQAPGMDLLTEHWRAFTTAKQVASVARQLGRTWRLTESLGATGWDFSFEGHKALGDWQAALGITLRCQHLAWYTMEGEAKRDYPAAISPQSPWWDAYPVVEDYFARLHVALTRGEEVRDILVVHPVESTWTMIRRGWKDDPAVTAFDRALTDLEDSLLCAHLDFDYGDEEMLGRLGAVTRRRGVPLLIVGRAAYTMVVVPPLRTVRASTLRLLREFADAGGALLFAGEPAACVDAEPSEEARALAARAVRAPAAGAALAAAAERAGRRVSVAGPDGAEIAAALYILREDAAAWYLFTCNTGFTDADRARDIYDAPGVRERTLAFPSVTVRVFVPAKGTPRELDPATGAQSAARARPLAGGGGWEIDTSLPALGSRLFRIPKKADTRPAVPAPVLRDARRTDMGDGRWSIALSEDNVLVLDRAGWRVGAGPWEGPGEILRVDRAVRTALGMAPRGGAMVQPWARRASPDGPRAPLALRLTFTVEAPVQGPLSLALECPGRWTVTMNGEPVPADTDCGWWVDPSLRRLPLDPARVHRGENVLLLSGTYDADHPGLEAMYLLGSFGVEVRGGEARLIDAPRSLALGDWTTQGLPFYAGSVSYVRSVPVDRGQGDRLFVHVPRWDGVAVRVIVDGRAAGVAAWEPREVEITDLVPVGPSSPEIAVQVVGHRRNSLGPLHHARRRPAWTGPGEFTTTGAQWTDDYQLVPCGLTAAPVLLVRRPA